MATWTPERRAKQVKVMQRGRTDRKQPPLDPCILDTCKVSNVFMLRDIYEHCPIQDKCVEWRKSFKSPVSNTSETEMRYIARMLLGQC